jgi:hypothetical protein
MPNDTIKYKILKIMTEVGARLNGDYTKITIPIGTLCEHTGIEEGFGKTFNTCSCTIGENTYTGISLPTGDLDTTYKKCESGSCTIAGGRRRPKKSRRSRSSRKRRQTRSK